MVTWLECSLSQLFELRGEWGHMSQEGPVVCSWGVTRLFPLYWNQEPQVRAKPDSGLVGAFLQGCLCHGKTTPKTLDWGVSVTRGKRWMGDRMEEQRQRGSWEKEKEGGRVGQTRGTVLVFWAAVTKYHSLGVLKQQESFAPQFWRLESPHSRCCRLVSFCGCKGESVPCLFLVFSGFLAISGTTWLMDASSRIWLYLHIAFSPCTCLCAQISPSNKDIISIGLGLSLMTSS